MSADNGVYILATSRGRGKREYRVAHAQAIDNLTDEPDYPLHNPQLSEDYAVGLFGKCRVFTDQRIAEGYAIRMLEEIEQGSGVCEYGIVQLNHPTVRFPNYRHVGEQTASRIRETRSRA